MKKQCFKCKRFKEVSQFYRHSEMADGYLSKCKICTKKDVQNRYNDPLAKERIIAYEKKRFNDPLRKAKVIEYQRIRRLKYKGKEIARRKVRRAVLDGRLQKKPCEICGDLKVEAHHVDYRAYLKVNWLCRKHHMEIHHKS